MKKQITIAGVVLVGAAVAALLVTQVSAEGGAKAPECNVSMGITGMSCAMACAPRVKEALQGVTGVATATVDFDTSSAKVSASGGVCTDAGAKNLVDAVKNAGFGGSIKTIEKSTDPKPAQAPTKNPPT